MRWRWAVVAVVGVAVLVVGRSWAEGIPTDQPLTYAGVLHTSDGEPLQGDHDIDVQVWDAANAGSMECASGESTVTLVGGHFSVELPNACADAVRNASDLWVEVVVDQSSLGRTKIGAVPFAIEAERASVATSVQEDAIERSADCVYMANAFHDCTCPAGTSTIGGGACTGASCMSPADSAIVESIRVSSDVWRMSCENSAGARIQCYEPFAMCLRTSL